MFASSAPVFRNTKKRLIRFFFVCYAGPIFKFEFTLLNVILNIHLKISLTISLINSRSQSVIKLRNLARLKLFK